jgi:predicted alpha/beta superfamily hydrolase
MKKSTISRKALTTFMLMLLVSPIFSLTYNVTVPAATKACYFAGEITGWTQQVMQKTDATHYTITFAAATVTQQYKYCSGPGWAYVENTADGNNRTFTANDIVSSWASIYDPGVVPVDVKYSVTVPIGTVKCYFAGAASNWAFQEMQKTDASHFTITINTATPDAYKYCSGPDWKYEELDMSDQAISNRNYSSSDVVIKWREVYNPVAGITYNVTVPTSTKGCYIAGEMNNWGFTAMNKIDETHYQLNIPAATNIQKYKYCAGPDWSYEELNADNTKVSDRSYTANDVVAKWTAVWDPSILVNPISNKLIVSSGTITRYAFNSLNIGARTVDIWLPAGYSTNKKYAVLYMHDGQMLFDATQTWNGQEWKVDETLSQLIQNGDIKDVIVVGIWNSCNRYSEYYPQKSMDYLPDNVKATVMGNMGNNPLADKYLSFITSELKPFIDSNFSVNTDAANTIIGGSSMGGLISWYALCEYPLVFGRAICMSTHWADPSVDSPEIPNSFRKYLLAQIPSPSTHKIYFDHGTFDLDANYGPNQLLSDTIMRYKGYTATNFESLVFTGDGHNEVSWANRYNVPVKFMLNQSDIKLGLTTIFDKNSYECGSVIPIQWTNTSVSNVKIEFSGDKGTTWTTIAASVSASAGSYNWTCPETSLYECKIRISDAANASTVSTSAGIFVLYHHLPTEVNPLLSIEYPVFCWPYNAYYPNTLPDDSEIINGKVGNACGPTLVTNLMRYWEFPRKGTGSKSFMDSKNCYWSADFGNTIYDFDKMQGLLSGNATQAEYDATATLMYNAGVGMHDQWRTGAREGVLAAFTNFFNYSKNAKFLNRADYTPEQWDKVFKSELSLGRPIGIGGDGGPLPEGGVAGHWFMCDGYNNSNLFHVRWDYGAANDQYLALYDFKPYHVNNYALMYLEPDKNGKKLELVSPLGNENWQQGSVKNIQWNSTGVLNLKIEFSADNGYTWTTLNNSVSASSGNCNVTIPNNVVSTKCKIRLTDADNINVYYRNKQVFSVYDTKSVALTSPQETVQIGVGAKLPIRWNCKGIATLKIEYSTNNGVNWNPLTEIAASENVYKWTVPNEISPNCKLRIVDKSDQTSYAVSPVFSIVATPPIGGPYPTDNNTVALYHFDNDFVNDANPSVLANPFNTINFSQNVGVFDYALKIDNTVSGVSSCIVLPNENALSLVNDWTIEFWFNISSWGGTTTAYPYMFLKSGANYFVFLDVTSKSMHVGYDYEGGAENLFLPNNVLTLNKWYHILFTRNTQNMSLTCQLRDQTRYLLQSKTINYNPNHIPKTNTNPINVGGFSGGSNVQFDGYIDEVRISNVVRDFTVTGFEDKLQDNFFEVYPNPTSRFVNIKLSQPSNGEISIINPEGQIVIKSTLNGLSQDKVDLSQLGKGIYFIQLTENSKTCTKKLIKM